ncbi:MAG: sulfite reductase [Desulfarculus sp.]|nr:sulfite reductase [Desulfarculus sp.]
MSDVRALVLQVLEKKQKRMMMNDLLKEVQKLDESVKKKDIKPVTTEMINDGTLAYWSSGSTTYFALPGSKAPEGED